MASSSDSSILLIRNGSSFVFYHLHYISGHKNLSLSLPGSLKVQREGKPNQLQSENALNVNLLSSGPT